MHRVAATLGGALGPEWTAPAVLGWIQQARPLPLLDNPDNPLGHLKMALVDVLTGPDTPPHPSELRRRMLAEQAAARRVDHASWCGRCDRYRRVVIDDHDQTLPCPDCSPTAEAAAPAGPADDWPEVAQPGSGAGESSG